MYDVYELFLVMFLTKSDHATEILESIPYKVYTYRLVYQFKAIKNRYTPIAALEHPATVSIPCASPEGPLGSQGR